MQKVEDVVLKRCLGSVVVFKKLKEEAVFAQRYGLAIDDRVFGNFARASATAGSRAEKSFPCET
jgi:hypothetical protein